MVGRRPIKYDPPRAVQVLTATGRWVDAVQHRWRWNHLRDRWQATVTLDVDASEVRPWQSPTSVFSKRQQRQPRPPPYR